MRANLLVLLWGGESAGASGNHVAHGPRGAPVELRPSSCNCRATSRSLVVAAALASFVLSVSAGPRLLSAQVRDEASVAVARVDFDRPLLDSVIELAFCFRLVRRVLN